MAGVVSKVFTYESLVHAVAGATGGGVAMGTLYPLDQVRLVLQVEDKTPKKRGKSKNSFISALKDIVEERGFSFLYQGHFSTQVSMGVSNFLYFYCYNGLKAATEEYMKRNKGSKAAEAAPLMNLLLATISGLLNVFATAPFWAINTRLKADKTKEYKGIIDCATKIVNNEGVLALWNGTLPSVVLVSNPVINYFVYDMLKERLGTLKKAAGKSLGPLDFFLIGVCAKSIATVLTYPLQVAQSRMRVRPQGDSKSIDDVEPYSYATTMLPQDKANVKAAQLGMIQCLQQIYRQKGFSGLFVGMETKLLLTVSMAAFQMMTYEQIVALVFSIMMRGKNKPTTAAK